MPSRRSSVLIIGNRLKAVNVPFFIPAQEDTSGAGYIRSRGELPQDPFHPSLCVRFRKLPFNREMRDLARHFRRRYMRVGKRDLLYMYGMYSKHEQADIIDFFWIRSVYVTTCHIFSPLPEIDEWGE